MSNIRRGIPLTSSRIEKIFPKLTPAQIRRVAAHGHIRVVEGGEVLYEQGHSASPFFVVVSGELEVVRPLFPGGFSSTNIRRRKLMYGAIMAGSKIQVQANNQSRSVIAREGLGLFSNIGFGSLI